jgi:hypothetical protein
MPLLVESFLLFGPILVADTSKANGGQNCCAGSRLLIQAPIYETLLKKLEQRVAKLRIGPPLDETTELGPLGVTFPYYLVWIHSLTNLYSRRNSTRKSLGIHSEGKRGWTGSISSGSSSKRRILRSSNGCASLKLSRRRN